MRDWYICLSDSASVWILVAPLGPSHACCCEFAPVAPLEFYSFCTGIHTSFGSSADIPFSFSLAEKRPSKPKQSSAFLKATRRSLP